MRSAARLSCMPTPRGVRLRYNVVVCVRARVCVCVCLCVCLRTKTRIEHHLDGVHQHTCAKEGEEAIFSCESARMGIGKVVMDTLVGESSFCVSGFKRLSSMAILRSYDCSRVSACSSRRHSIWASLIPFFFKAAEPYEAIIKPKSVELPYKELCSMHSSPPTFPARVSRPHAESSPRP